MSRRAATVIISLAVVLFGAALTYSRFTTADASSVTKCGKAVGPFTGGKTQILQSNGNQYVPYGITVTGLAYSGYQAYSSQTTAQINAAAASWCVNTIRLQVAPYNLVGKDGKTYSKAFMTALNSAVQLAESFHLVVVISAQYEAYGHTHNPTANTAMFWKDITAVYGSDPQVAFDLYNEPQIDTGNTAQTWQIWRNGGTVDGNHYLGMQTLVNDVRQQGAQNVLWVEGPEGATTLDQLSNYLLAGKLLVYDFHHPAGPHNAATWQHEFGYLVTDGIAPVVDGEWTNWASTTAECWPDARTAAPAYLTYLHNRGIGMTAWALLPGVLVTSADDLSSPTKILANWACQDGLNEGAGSLILQWYMSNNGPTKAG